MPSGLKKPNVFSYFISWQVSPATCEINTNQSDKSSSKQAENYSPFQYKQKLTDVMPPKSKTIPHARLWIVWPKSICKDDLGTNTVECSALQVFCCVTNYQGDFIKSVY